jgi:hypothetical protein
MQKKLFRPVVGVFLLIFLTLVACSSDPKKALVGKWQEPPNGETIQFFAEGTLSINGKGGSYTGTYTVLDATHLKFEVGGLGALAGPIIFTYELSSNTLTLTHSGDKPTTYKRVS